MKTTTRAFFIQSMFAIILWWICLAKIIELSFGYPNAIDKWEWVKELLLMLILFIVISIARFKIYKAAGQ